MTGDRKHYYFVHGFNLGNQILPNFKNITRESVIHYRNVFKYFYRAHKNYEIWINKYGAVVVFQDVSEYCIGKVNAEDLYRNGNQFKPIYRTFVEDTRDYLKAPVGDSDYTFFVTVGAPVDKFEWGRIELAGSTNRRMILVEALFVFQLCSQAETLLNQLDLRRHDEVFHLLVVNYTEDLFNTEEPSGFLVADKEIKLMRELYEVWNITTRIRLIRERFNQSVQNYSFMWQYRDRKQETLMNLFLAGIAALSLLQVTSIMADVEPVFDSKLFKTLVISVAIGIFLFGAIRYVFLGLLRRLTFRARSRFRLWRLSRLKTDD